MGVCTWERHEGCIGAGNDVLSQWCNSVAEAQAVCQSNSRIKGFTFLRNNDNGPMYVYFKSSTSNAAHDPSWLYYVCPPSDAHRLMQSEELIEKVGALGAGFDLESGTPGPSASLLGIRVRLQ
jgi:hypothetical protein